MLAVRGDLGQRDEDEFALQHAWMWHLQFRPVDGVMAIEQNINVDQARPFANELLASHMRFDSPERAEQIRRGNFCLGFHDAIQKPRLLAKIDWLGLIDR